MYGFISGGQDCQDIVYIETNKDKVDDPLTQEAYSGAGKCLIKKKIADISPGIFGRPKCAAQEVPGYRFDKFPRTILSDFVQVGRESDVCL